MPRANRSQDWSPVAGPSSWSAAGALAANTWLRSRGMGAHGHVRWHVQIALDVANEPASVDFDEAVSSRFHIDLFAEEWGIFFCHRGRASCIRVTDIAFVHGRDDHALLGLTPPLKDLGSLIRRLEKQYTLRFRREHALIHTNLANAETSIREWLATL